jgi:hypothetical protein
MNIKKYCNYEYENEDFITSDNKEIAKIFTVTKDEYDLIEDFINYHSYIFGVQNIYIIDNGSTNQKVLDVYDKFIAKGGTVYKHLDYVYNGQSDAFIKYMNMHKDECKFLIGLDTDEFIYLNNVDKPCDRNTILKYLENLPEDVTMFRILTYLFSIVDTDNVNYINNKIEYPAKYINYFINNDQNFYKYFYRSNTFISTSVGNHTGITLNQKEMICDLGYYHFSNTGARRSYERSYSIILGYKYLDDNDTIENKINILKVGNLHYGFHRVKVCLYYLLKKYIILLYIKYLKRLPTNDEIYVYIPDIKDHQISYNNWNTNIDIYNIDKQLRNREIFGNILDINYDSLLFFESNIDKSKYVFNNNLSNYLANIKKIV